MFGDLKRINARIAKAINRINPDRKHRDLMRRVKEEQQFRTRQTIDNFNTAITMAEVLDFPDRRMLNDAYKSACRDGHFSALLETIIIMVLSNKYHIVDRFTGETDEAATEAIRGKWFRDLVKYIVESKFHGFSLVQLGDVVGNEFESVSLIGREYVVPTLGIVKNSTYEFTNKADKVGHIDFTAPDWQPWLMPFGDPQSLGILERIAPLLILKKEMVANWAEFGEIYGQPARIGYSTEPDNEDFNDMLEKAGTDRWVSLDNTQRMELLNSSQPDAFNVYDRFIDRVNSEVSKAVLLQTGTTDEKSFVGSANVHKSILDRKITAELSDITDAVNAELLPRMQRFGMAPVTGKFEFEQDEKVDLSTMKDVLVALLPHYDVDEEFVADFFGIEITGVKESAEQSAELNSTEVLARIKNLYAKKTDCC